MIPTQILRVLSTIQTFDVPALLMGGQAGVLYGAAEYSRDLDLAVRATPDAIQKLKAAFEALHARVIAVPTLDARYLTGSALRGVADFATLWDRRTTVMLRTDANGAEVAIEIDQ